MRNKKWLLVLACASMAGLAGCDDLLTNRVVPWDDCLGMSGKTFCDGNSVIACDIDGVMTVDHCEERGLYCIRLSEDEAECSNYDCMEEGEIQC